MTDYVTQAEIEEESEITKEDLNYDQAAWDSLLGKYKTRISRKVDRYTGRDFEYYEAQKDTYSVGAYDRRTVEIKGPIITLTKIETRTEKDGTYTDVDSKYYTFNNYGIIGDRSDLVRISLSSDDIRLALQGGYPNAYTSTERKRWRSLWMSGYENLKVTATYGFATVPDEIKEVILEHIATLLQHRIMMKNKKVGSLRNLAAGDPTTIPDFSEDQKIILNYYKTIRGGPGVL